MTSITNIQTFSLLYLKAVRDVQYQLVAGLSFMVWDSLLVFGEEMEYIWRMRRCMLKWFYFYFRYILLAVQIFHLASSQTLSSGLTSDFLCLIWYRYIVFIAQISISTIDIILATRVYALFNRSRKIGIFLGSLILLDMGLAGRHIIKCPTPEYFEACMLLKAQRNLANTQTVVVMIAQSTIVGMIIFKHSVGIRLGWGRTPLLSFVLKDTARNYLAVFLGCGITLMVVGFNDRTAISVFYWSTPLFSAVGCRFILNMERFARGYSSEEEIMLTSYITV